MKERLCPDPARLARAEPAPPASFVIFGAYGDLTKRLLIPALYNLSVAGLLAEGFEVIGVDHNERNDETYRQHLTEAMQGFVANQDGEFAADSLNSRAWGWLRDRLFYLTGDFEDPATYQRLGERLATVRQARGHGNCVFYLATAPRFFGSIVERLAEAGLMREQEGDFRRVVIEKPFGTDLASARALNAQILSLVEERQVFRIDHFLGKETVQNILALRFANGIFEPLWRREHIDHVQITAAETVGVEGRGRFYETTGALRDMVPNHMMQLLAMTAMEAPSNFGADAVRAEKAKVVQAIRPLSPEELARDLVRGQYDAGMLRGAPVPGYRQEPNVAPDSGTETYVAMKLQIDNWRWAGVPFYIRTGKRLAARWTEIAIQFKPAPYTMFRETPVDCMTPNLMVLHIQPNEGISLALSAKQPGPALHLADVRMDFRYADWFKAEPSTGYETLLYDVLIGDASLFQRADNVEAGWAAVQPMLASPPAIEHYAAGSEGPAGAEALLARDGRQWLKLA
ncbi:glucose-6-phosphate dehydrogenase [Siccirubricoccus sp. KC 17139]|uniref:Glucose-6-phosphate 1-dehydrogenase n=1 Tax=Siccirubricoccus soli TaxID=2899147 RepID=A0ABT1D642_9PROT|nr:glucose-6-phosphate dehydrogenase [Siccirubricoccus soli]MCO6417399.1 glucose-6-phosphate dehydrogenase [Siccirubricoccus soli]MCP2683534.1 glucose-6-phosphate dehydrogenase [Siccirubricoccus soli]